MSTQRTRTCIFIFDPHNVVEAMTLDETIVKAPLTLDRKYGLYAVVTSMLHVDSGASWFIVQYFNVATDAHEAYEHENAMVIECAGDDTEDYSDMHVNVGLIYL